MTHAGSVDLEECCRAIAAAVLAIGIAIPVHAQSGQISGRIRDVVSGEPVSSVRVTLDGTTVAASTDVSGRFTLLGVPSGLHTLRAVYAGYATLVRDSVRVEPGLTALIELQITPIVNRLDELVVTPGTFSFMGQSRTRQTMSREDIESAPQFAEDIFRAVNRLPGLASGDYSAHFSIRGGRHDETLILLDGLEIYEPYHLKDFNEGAISIVDVEAIDDVDLMTGGFSAKYGNRRSGVLNITSRTPDAEGTRYSVGLSFMNARARAEGTFARERGSWFVSARRGYMDLVFKLVNVTDLPSPAYYDVFANFRYALTPRHALTFNVLRAGDTYTFDAEATTGFQDTIPTRERANNTYGNSYAWATLRSAPTDNLLVQTMASAGLVTHDRDGAEAYIDERTPLYSVTNSRDFSILGLRQDWTWYAAPSFNVEFGADIRAVRTTYANTSLVGQDPNDPTPDTLGYYPVRNSSGQKENGATVGAWLSTRVRPIETVTLEIGVRHDHFSYTGDSDLSPRVNALVALGARTSLRFGWGHYRQSQGIADLAVENGQDVYFSSELSRQGTVGIEHMLGSGGLLRLEGYYKTGSSLRPRYRNWKGGLDVFPESNEDRILVYPINSTSKGIEAYYQQNFGDRISVRGSYALSSARERIRDIDNVNEDETIIFATEQPSPQDQHHAFNLDATWRPNPTWSVNLSWAYHSGWPTTLESMHAEPGPDGTPIHVIRPGQLYGSRLPAYQRTDVRLTRRRPTSSGGEFRFFVELVNLTNHSNVSGYDYFRELDGAGQAVLQRDEETWFTILPSLGVSWTGRF